MFFRKSWVLKFFIFTTVWPGGTGVSLEARFVASGISNFTHNLYKILKEDSQFGIVSPLALTTALLALASGSNGFTETILKTGLRLEHIERQTLERGIADILYAVKDRPAQSVRFQASLRILVPPDIHFWPEYSSRLHDSFNNATIVGITPSTVNGLRRDGWLDRNFGSNHNFTTVGRHDQNFNLSSAHDPIGGVVLSNIEFMGGWKKKFGFLSTRPGHFFLGQNDRLSVHMMNHDDYFPYAMIPDLDAEAVMLPVQGDRFGFVLLVPNSRLGLDYLEGNLKRQPLQGIPTKLKRTWVDLWIPRFNLTSTLLLAQSGTLNRLGIGNILYPSADFGGISCNNDLYFTDVTVRATVSVNEEGIGSLKATVPRVEKLAVKRNPVTVTVDHPFLFFLYEFSTQSILIIGRKLN